MRKFLFFILFSSFAALGSFGQTAYNPFTQNIHFAPEPTAFGFECGTIQTVSFDMGLTTSADATQWQTNPLTVTVCLTGFTYNGVNPATIVSGTYASNFNWAFMVGSSNCLIGTQNQTLVGVGSDPLNPNPGASGAINLSLKVPDNSPVGTILGVNVSLQVPSYMSLFNSTPDDVEATQTQTFCNCYALTDAGAIAADQTFCVSGNPALFTNTTSGSGGTGGTIQYQWQQFNGSTWNDVSGATNATYDAPTVSATTQYRRNAKRSLCGAWLNSNIVTVTINPNPTANAGVDKTLNCTTTSTTIGTTSISGNTYTWSPATGLSSTSIAQPTANPLATTTYTVTVLNANGCSSTDAVLVTVNTTPPTADAGLDKNLNCSVTSAQIGTASVSGSTYSWLPSTGLSSTTVAQPTANPSSTTTYTVTVTGTNGCTSTDAVIVNVNTVAPFANAGVDKNLNCTTTSTNIGSASISGSTYSWSPSTGLNSATVAQPTANPTTTTTYTVTVTGSNGCTASDFVTVNVNTTTPTANAGVDKNLNCSVTSAQIGSTAITGNTYSWLPATGLSSTTIAQPTASPTVTTTYTVTVTGSNGCTATDVVVVNVNTTAPTADAGVDKNLNCTTTSTSIGTTAISGNTYSWSPSVGLSSTTIAQPTATPSSTQTYTVTVTAANGCTATDAVVVNVNTTVPTVNAGPDKNLTCTTTSATIGSVAISGNMYSWSPATGLSSTTIAQPVANPSVTTTYTVTVTGSNGCTATDFVTVNVNTTLPTVNAGPDKNLDCTTTSATIGTTGISGNTYSWSPATGLNSTTIAQPVASPSTTTSYTVTVTGSNGCAASDVVTVNVSLAVPVANAGLDKELNCTTTSTTIGTTSISGNTYSWSPSTGLSSTSIAQPTASPTVSTTYTVTVTAANGCSSNDEVVVTVNTSSPVVNAGPDKTVNCTTTSTTIGTTAVSGNSYSWSPATGLSSTTIAQPTASPSVTTTYTVTVTGANGCTATDAVTVNVNTTTPTANAGVDKNLDCTTTSTTIGTTGVSGNTYSWSPATGLNSTTVAQPIASPSVTTTYTVTVTSTNGCTATDAVIVNVNTALPTVDAGIDKNLNCTTTATTIGTTGVSGNTYSWSPSIGLSSTTVAQPVASPLATTTYTVTVTGSNGCTASDVVTVNVNTTTPVVNAGPDKTVCSLNSTMIGTAAVGGNTYSWSPATGLSATNIAQPTATPSVTTTYTVTVTGANGCTSTDAVTVYFKEGSVGNYVWMDINGDGLNNESTADGINGIVVELWSTNDLIQGNNDDQLVGTTTTASNSGNPGYYQFTICNDGDYYVKFPLTTGGVDQLTTQTTTAGTDNNSDAQTSNGLSPIFTINTNGTGIAKNNPTIDAGYVPLLSLGNLVWNDLDHDGIKDANETGITNAVVKVYADANSDGTPDGAALQTYTTTSNGSYVFNGLTPGNYIVGVTPPSPASGNAFVSSGINETNPNSNVDNNDNGITTVSGETRSGTVTLSAGAEPTGETPNNGTAPDANSNLTVDFAFYQPVNISGNVFNDINGPSNVDGTGIGSPSGTQVYANLVDANGNVVATVPVNTNGTYQFNDVMPNATYTMVLSTIQGTVGNPAPVSTLPTGWASVSEDCCDNTGNDGTTNGITTVVVGMSDVPNVNFGIRQPLSLGNIVWKDVNRNGIQDNGELGINTANVKLYIDANSDGTPDGAAIANTTTDANGLYIFNNLNPGNYIIGVTPPSIAGGSYTSSITGQEANPNLNVDANDNGIVTIAGETRSGTIILAAGTEPLGETPNNAASGIPDANTNLTVDFGFFLCPANFTFTPQYVCPNSTLDLATLEPANYTGGVWSQNGNPLASKLVNTGTYVYTFTDGDCIATGSVTVGTSVPDYTPTITITPSAITGIDTVRVILKIEEILNRSSCSPIYVLIPRLAPRYSFSYEPTATSILGAPVSNADWQYFDTNPNFYIWKYVGATTFPAGGTSRFGYYGMYNPNDTDGETTFSVQIFQGSGGETNQTNNTDSEVLIYFR